MLVANESRLPEEHWLKRLRKEEELVSVSVGITNGQVEAIAILMIRG